MPNHTLELRSTGHGTTRRDALYNASCLCGQWESNNVTAKHARVIHGAHLEVNLGPEAHGDGEAANG